MNATRRLLIALSAALAAVSASADGLRCNQVCNGPCLQAACAPGAGAAACGCSSGALRLDADTFAAFCRVWGAWHGGCSAALPVASSIAPADPLPSRGAMLDALLQQNPFAAALIAATIQDDPQGTGASVQGLLHDSHYDEITGLVAHAPAIAFTGRVAAADPSTVAIDITVQGDLASLAFLDAYATAAAPAAVVPLAVHGAATSGGLHGSLTITGPGHSSQALTW
jgi:hypothetical protein